MRKLMTITFAVLASAVGCGGSQAAHSAPTSATPESPSSNASSGESSASATAGAASGKADAADPDEFVVRTTERAKEERGQTESKIRGTKTEAAVKFTVIDKDKGPVKGIVIALSAPDGKKFYTEETNADGYAEVLVPIAQKYDLVYLGLGRRDIAAKVTVTDEPNQNLRLTLRYKRIDPPAKTPAASPEPRFVLEGVTFDSGKATLRED